MASRRTADGLLAILAKATSAGVLPALVAAVLALSGCGGGDSSAARDAGSVESTAIAPASTAAAGPGGAAKKTGARSAASGGEEATANPSKAASGAGKAHSKAPLPTGQRMPRATPQQKAEATVADIGLYAPELPASSPPTLLAANTCDGTDRWPRLSWQDVPAETAELALLAMNSQPVKDELFFDWALAGIDPSLTSVEAGKLPKGAVVGQNSFGHNSYSICPPPGSQETYIFILYALPKALHPKPGFAPLPFREAALDISHKAGLLALAYTRG